MEALVIQMPYYIKPDAKKKWHDELVMELKSGVVILPYGSKVITVPDNVEVRIKDGGIV